MVQKLIGCANVLCIAVEVQHYFAGASLVRQEQTRDVPEGLLLLPFLLRNFFLCRLYRSMHTYSLEAEELFTIFLEWPKERVR